jgi:hypothetical protein
MMSALGLGLEVLAILGDEEIQALWAEPSKMVDILADIILHGMLPPRE